MQIINVSATAARMLRGVAYAPPVAVPPVVCVGVQVDAFLPIAARAVFRDQTGPAHHTGIAN